MNPSSFPLSLRAGAAAALALAVAGCGHKGPAAAAIPAGVPAVTVEAVDAIARTVPLTVESVGRLDAASTVSYVPLVNARVDAVLVADGADVKAGDTLFRLDKRAYAAALERMQAEKAAREAQVAALQARQDRSKELVAGDFVSPQQAQESLADLAAAQAALAAADAGVAQATIDLENCEPKAAFDGRVGLVRGSVVPGAFLAQGGDPVVELRALDKLRVDFTVPESALPLLAGMATGANLSVIVASHEDATRTLEGPVAAYDNVVDPHNRSVKVRAMVPNPGHQFWPGQFVDVKMKVGSQENAVLVPYRAVNTGPNGAYLYVIEGGKAKVRSLQLGPQIEDQVVVQSGVAAGDKVIVSGQLGLQDGSDVQVAAVAPSP